MHFDELELMEPLLRAVKDCGYEEPTPIQRERRGFPCSRLGAAQHIAARQNGRNRFPLNGENRGVRAAYFAKAAYKP